MISGRNPDLYFENRGKVPADFEALNKKFDLIFIDGDHHYEMVRNDTAKVFQSLFHSGSTVVWHDYAFNPEKIRFEVLAGILDGCPTEFHHQGFQEAGQWLLTERFLQFVGIRRQKKYTFFFYV